MLGSICSSPQPADLEAPTGGYKSMRGGELTCRSLEWRTLDAAHPLPDHVRSYRVALREVPHRGVGAVDDGRQGEHSLFRVKHDRVHERVPDDGHELAQLQVVLRVVLRSAQSNPKQQHQKSPACAAQLLLSSSIAARCACYPPAWRGP